MNGGRILLPTDSSLPALAATIEAVKLAKERKTGLIILYVTETAPTVQLEMQAGNVALKRCKDIDGILFAKKLAAEEGVDVEEVAREGPVAGEIVNVAKAMSVSTIVLGSSRPHGMTELYLGDVAKSVARMAQCEVITINPTPEQGKKALELARSIAKREIPKTVEHITTTKQFKVGLGLFTIFTVIYAVFMVMGSYDRSLMGQHILGLNVGLLLGMLVILIAIVMAVMFNRYASAMEKKQEG
ncbi:MAG: Universal stress protein family protein [Methanomassiliicoccales archaeon PtaU1.Bin124]|nr:MAG: Universal stress protein family protein [Methanomassiliicoccales archaeon PtaU1.Bin124]